MNGYDSTKVSVIDLSAKSLPEIIKVIELRPLMWLPEKHIMYCWTLLAGYLYTSNDPVSHSLMKDFDVFINEKYNIRTAHGWAKNINHMCSNPHDAMDKFFKEFKEFMETYDT